MKKLKYAFIPIIAVFLHILNRKENLLPSSDRHDDNLVYSDVIMTSSGPVRGRLVTDDEMEVRYYAYLGIPYAESPTGSLRFKPPVTNKPCTEILNATKIAKPCFEYELSRTKSEMSEDCLYLNAYVLEKTKSAKSVLVIIHGDGFIYPPILNKPLYLGPHVLYIKNDIIVVTINFRLGAFGYFNLDLQEATGNNQLKDIILALKWINNNIKNFGGDKNRITLIGFGSGAAVIEYLMMSNKSVELFQQAILLSGSALSYKTFGRYPKQSSLDLVEQLGIEDDDPEVIIDKMRKIEARKIVEADEDFIFYEKRLLFRVPTRFLPHVEIDSKHTILTETPKNLLENMPRSNVKILMGTVEEENYCLLPLVDRFSLKRINDDIELLIPSDIQYPRHSKRSTDLAKSIKSFYFGKLNITVKNINDLMLLNGDAQFTNPINKLLSFYNKLYDIYFFIFNFVNDLNVFSVTMNKNVTKMGHADAAFYVINNEKLRQKYKSNDMRTINMSRSLLSFTSNFVKFGNPTPPNYNNGVQWPLYRNRKQFLEIGEKIKVKTEFSEAMKRRIEFWRKVYDDYEQYLKEGGKIEPRIIS